MAVADSTGIRITAHEDDEEIGHLYVYILSNDIHAKPFAFIEDVYVDPLYRGKGIAQRLVTDAIGEARKQGCYKLILTSRFGKEKVHELYTKLDFKRHGYEFRMNL
ncbi:MAG: GNAT family N-acetyltransferase [bacterium]|nr:GNAT family N-acetyltransferase [bacterium]